MLSQAAGQVAQVSVFTHPKWGRFHHREATAKSDTARAGAGRPGRGGTAGPPGGGTSDPGSPKSNFRAGTGPPEGNQPPAPGPLPH